MSNSSSRWPQRSHGEVPVPPSISTAEELRGLWKVANGWKAPAAEGRVYVMQLTAERDAPVYTLSSAAQPFYKMRLNPTSSSARVTVSRWDPSRPFKGAAAPTGHKDAATPKTDKASWQEVLTTTLEEDGRRLPPHDGLVALLYPAAAGRMALDQAAHAATVRLAEHERARLVWDADAGNYYLAHPALALPFCVTVERTPAWSRIEYTLEHVESPRHLGRLTRDGTGTGWLEIDTAVAARVDAVFLADVAVAALLLVAHADARRAGVEAFAPPPRLCAASPDGSLASRREGRLGRLSRLGRRESSPHGPARDAKKAPKAGRSRMEQWEMDMESQSSELSKKLEGKDKDGQKLPAPARALIALLTISFKCVIWSATAVIKMLAFMMGGCFKCVTSKKL